MKRFNIKRVLIGTSVAAALVGGGVVLPATVAPAHPASAMGTCHVVKTKHTKANCNTAKQICAYYTYETVCGI